MTTTTTIKTAVATNRELIAGMNAFGFKTKVRAEYVACPECEAKALALVNAVAAHPVEKAALLAMPWYQAKPAIVFHKEGSGTLKACRCGWRQKWTASVKPTCPTCGAIIKEVGGRCFGPKCQPPTQEEIAIYNAEAERKSLAKKAAYDAKRAAKEGNTQPVVNQQAANQYVAPPVVNQYVSQPVVNQQAENHTAPKVCITPGCNNTVPEGRLVRCESCRANRRAATKESASCKVQM